MSAKIFKKSLVTGMFYLSNPLGWLLGIIGLIRSLNPHTIHCKTEEIFHNKINYMIKKYALKKMCPKQWFPAKEILEMVKAKK